MCWCTRRSHSKLRSRSQGGSAWCCASPLTPLMPTLLASLVDAGRHGRACNVEECLLRFRYKDGVFLGPRKAGARLSGIEIDLEATSNVFELGHTIRFEVQIVNLPRWVRNSNTGCDGLNGRDAVVADNWVRRSAMCESRIRPPVVGFGLQDRFRESGDAIDQRLGGAECSMELLS